MIHPISTLRLAVLVVFTTAVHANGQIDTFINGRQLKMPQMHELVATYGSAPPAGRYWYDSRSGLYGLEGHGAAGFIRPGHYFGPLATNASNGRSGVFLNGRELDTTEAFSLRRITLIDVRGRWWLNGHTGALGIEGESTPFMNLFRAGAAAQQSNNTGYTWRSKWTDIGTGSSGKCSYVNIPGSGTVMTGDCDE